jgi:hypothetical protein
MAHCPFRGDGHKGQARGGADGIGALYAEGIGIARLGQGSELVSRLW